GPLGALSKLYGSVYISPWNGRQGKTYGSVQKKEFSLHARQYRRTSHFYCTERLERVRGEWLRGDLVARDIKRARRMQRAALELIQIQGGAVRRCARGRLRREDRSAVRPPDRRRGPVQAAHGIRRLVSDPET